jgi:hypothetical protein
MNKQEENFDRFCGNDTGNVYHLSEYGYERNGFNPEVRNFFKIPHCVWGDYIGGSVDRANIEYLQKHYPEYVDERTYDYSTLQLVIWLDGDYPEEFIDLINALEDYPLLDEETHSNVEYEIKGDYWNEIVTEWYERMEFDHDLDLQRLDEEMPDFFYDECVIETGCIPYFKDKKRAWRYLTEKNISRIQNYIIRSFKDGML